MGNVSMDGRVNQTQFKVKLIFVICCCLTITACDLLNPVRHEKNSEPGELRLSFSAAKLYPAKTILPAIDMSLATYEIFGSGPNEAAFEESAIPEGSVVKVGLEPGQWEIQVTGRNKDGTRIGVGELTTNILPGEVATETVLIHPLEGTGTLEIQISWPDSVLSDPQVEGMIESSDGTKHDLAFPLSADGLSAFSRDTLSAGYYKLTVQLTDADVPIWGALDAVRIFAGYPSTTSYPLVEGIGRSGFRIILVDAMEDPIDVTLTGVEDVITVGNNMTVIADPGEPVESYQWYLQGEPIEEATANTITLGENLSSGTYRLDVLVTKGEVFSSQHATFRVIDPNAAGSSIGPLVINEIMIDPDSIAERDGEWVEIVNIGSTAVDLMGWTLKDEGSNRHTISAPLVLPAGGYVVLGENADIEANDNLPLDYEYGNDIGLTNNGDAILLYSPEGELVDAVRWGGGYNFPIESGKSIALINPLLDNRRSVNWEASTTLYGEKNMGTPGQPNN